MNKQEMGVITRRLRMKIPEGMKCLDGCTDCCGPIPFNKWEWSQVKDKRSANSIDCPYSIQGKCDIYDDRPLICRLYGTVEDLQCPHGVKPLRMLTAEEGREILKRYKRTGL